MSQAAAPPAAATIAEVETRVLDVVRTLAEELGGARAAGAVVPAASLEREVGLGSLERVELLLRLENAFGRALDDRVLQAETPAALARLIAEGGRVEGPAPAARAEQLDAATAPQAAATVHESLWRRAQSQPARPHVYLRRDDGEEETITYGDLLSEAAAVAGGLRDGGLRRGDTVALMLPTGREFLAAFQGILMAGGVPVPIYPPARLDRLEEYAQRQSAILADAEVRALVTVARARGVAAVLRASVPSLREVVTVGELAARGASWAAPEGAGADPAFIQYTSGSRAPPRGAAHPRQPAGEHPRRGRRPGRAAHRRRRELAAAVPRHGAHRHVALLHAPRHPARPAEPARVPRAPGEVAVVDPPAPGHPLPRAELRLRALRAQDPRPRAGGPRPLVLARGPQRRGAGEPADDRPLRRAIRSLRLPPGG